MKKIFLFILPIFALAVLAVDTNAAGSNPYCVGMSGTFTATNWPGGTIDVACAGDTGTAGCKGDVESLKPGQSFDFNNCTCPPYSSESIFGKSGCLVIGKKLSLKQLSNGNRPVQGDTSLPEGCSLNKPQPIACGSNGQTIKSSFTITCKATPTPTSTPTPTPTPTPTLIPTNTPTPTPSSCPVPGKVLNVKVNCPNCSLKAD